MLSKRSGSFQVPCGHARVRPIIPSPASSFRPAMGSLLTLSRGRWKLRSRSVRSTRRRPAICACQVADARLFGVCRFQKFPNTRSEGVRVWGQETFGCWGQYAAQPAAFARLVSIGVGTEGSRTALGERTQPGSLHGGFPCAQFWPVLL